MKFTLLVELIKTGVMINDMRAGTRTFMKVLPLLLIYWPQEKNVVEEYDQHVSDMCDDYMRYLYNSAPKPVWAQRLPESLASAEPLSL